jgi:hypothetical protein
MNIATTTVITPTRIRAFAPKSGTRTRIGMSLSFMRIRTGPTCITGTGIERNRALLLGLTGSLERPVRIREGREQHGLLKGCRLAANLLGVLACVARSRGQPARLLAKVPRSFQSIVETPRLAVFHVAFRYSEHLGS